MPTIIEIRLFVLDGKLSFLFVDRPSPSVEQNQHDEKISDTKSEGSENIYKSNNDDSLKLREDSSLTEEIQDEFNKKLQCQSKVLVDTTKDAAQDFSSPGESNEDSCIPRRRSKAFSVGKRNNDPDMLAKRGSALINAYMGDTNIKPDDSEFTRSSSFSKGVDNSAVNTNDLKDENEVTANSESIPATFAVSNTSANETTDSDITPVNTESEDQDHRRRADTTSSAASRSGDESSISALYKDTPHRKRSATYENDIRKVYERQERIEKQLTDRRMIYGVRPRRTRVSVKDQIKQLENREQNDSSKTVRNNKPSAVVTTPVNKFGSEATSDTHSTSDNTQVSENGNTLDIVDGKENINGNTETAPASHLKSHEPLTRLYVAGENSGIFQPPRSPVPKYKPVEDKFCALKMDISLESPRTPSSPSSDDDSDDTDVAMETPSLPKWKGRGLTPRNSSQEPEFV